MEILVKSRLDVEHRYICPNCGSDDIKGTRSGLLLEIERLLIKAIETDTAPKYLCLENVKNLVGKQFKPDFDAWLKRLEHLNYNTHWIILNSKDCGVPQNRERVFAMSIRKDIDTGEFTFPLPFDTGLRLKDILEKNVDERYYINTERASNLIQQLIEKGQLKGQRECCDSTINDPSVRDVSNAIIARYDAGISNYRQTGLAVAEPQPILVRNQGTEYVKNLDESVTLKARDWKGWDNYGSTAIVESEKIDDQKRLGGLWDGETRHQAGSVWDSNGMSPTLDTAQGDGRMPHIVEETNTINQIGNYVNQPGRDNPQRGRVYDQEYIAPTLNCMEGGNLQPCIIESNEEPSFVIGSTQKNAFVGNGEISSALTSAMGMGGGHVPMVGFEDDSKPICVGNTTPSGKSQCNAVYSTDGVSQTLCAGTHGYATGSILEESEYIYRIRKLTVRECAKLMGFEFEDWDKCVAIGISNSAGYKACGNSIVTNCISLLFEHLYQAQYDETYVCTDERMQNFTQPGV